MYSCFDIGEKCCTKTDGHGSEKKYFIMDKLMTLLPMRISFTIKMTREENDLTLDSFHLAAF